MASYAVRFCVSGVCFALSFTAAIKLFPTKPVTAWKTQWKRVGKKQVTVQLEAAPC